MRKLLGTAALTLALLTPAIQAQAEISDTQWDEVREFLERNPEIHGQLERMMDRELGPDQIAEDAAYIADNTNIFYDDPMSPVLGNPDGTIHVVKFSDFRCGHCRNVTPELKKLIESDPRVKLIIKEFPILGPDSVEAAKFALAAYKVGGSEAYAHVEDALFDLGGSRMTGYLLEEIAAEAGLDAKSVIDLMDSPEIAEELASTAQIAQDMKITGTPAILIGDVVVRGSIPVAAMQQGISEVYGTE